MIKPDANSKFYPLYTTVIGLFSFLISSVFSYFSVYFLSKITYYAYLIALSVEGGIGLLLFGLFMRMSNKTILKMAGFGLIWRPFADLLAANLCLIFLSGVSGLFSCIYNILFNILFCGLFGLWFYGIKSAKLFFAALPFGVLYNVLVSKISIASWMIFTVSIGTCIGLCVGEYAYQNMK